MLCLKCIMQGAILNKELDSANKERERLEQLAKREKSISSPKNSASLKKTKNIPSHKIKQAESKSIEDKLFKAIEQHQQVQDKIARAFAKPDFSALSGYQVQGGLPSLGKRK